ncbi:hypothetical protein M408DRAFT_30107 [Serendipita vermifera MAFF 305830]|uniref:NB-ARC domain-containing protein n=1 Tax=Serendipita vermifera MAFF 305830 TaxID=933852 RepID=A0A0C3ANE2_SERVB|nr:hypothetical protein M408DRAFT_30107 [Serendipita vermifera MAFF 305830]
MAHTSNYLNDEEVARAMNQCVDTLKDGIGSVTLEQLKYIGGGDVLAPELLELTPNYVERKIPTEFLEKCLLNADGSTKPGSKRVIVTGMGGCGKTQLVRKFIENHGDLFVSVFFIDGSSKETIKRDFTEHVRALGGALSQKSFEESMRFLSLPVQGGERLLVMDNVDDPKVNISAFLPKWKRGAVIITSRNGSHGQLNPSGHLQLDVMSPDESTELLIRGSGSTQLSGSHREAAAKVAEELGNLPIALVQAASHIFRTGCSDTTYVSLLKTSRERVLSDPATNQIDMRYTTAFAAFDASYSILPSKAQLMLHLLSFFHRQKLPVDCIGFDANNGFSYQEEYLDRGEEYERGREFLKEIFYSHGKWDPAEVESIIGSLRAHSLITVISTETTRLLQMHSLVHEWARLRVPSDEVVHFQDAAIRLLCCNAQESNYAMMQYLQLHVQALSYIWETMHVNDMESFGFILKESGDYSGCLRLRERLRSVLSDRLGVDHHFTIVTSVNLAATYRQLGRYAEAEVMFIEVVKQRTKLLGFNHLDTINASANLADIYRRLGRYAEAEALEVEVLKQRTRLLGVNHPDTLRASASLAATYIQLGRYVEAEVLDAQVLKWRTQMLGVDHLETIFASAGLAATYTQLGRHAEAEVLKVEVLNQRTKLLGVDHPDTIQATANLAVTYSQLSRHAEVERLQTDVLQRRTRLFGDRHPNTLLAMWSLASTYKAMKRHSEALELARKAHLGYGETLGDSHPYSQQVAALLASLTAEKPVNLG